MNIVKQITFNDSRYNCEIDLTFNESTNEIIITSYNYIIEGTIYHVGNDKFTPHDGDVLILTEHDGYTILRNGATFDVRDYSGWAYTIGYINGSDFILLHHVSRGSNENIN